MLLTSADRQGRHRLAGLGDLSIVIIAATGLSLFWSQCSYLSGVSRWYHSAQQLRATGVGPKADFDLTTFPWHVANARVFDVVHDRITIVTSSEPFGYQAVATVSADGARAADFQFDIEVEKGGVTIGLLQGGKWIAANSSGSPGRFSDWNSAQLGYRRSLTLVVANNNPAGESRVTITGLWLFLQR